MCGSEPGIDPYTRAVSDVYQDLFGEGSFIGKGIYEVDVFERTLSGRFPENRILSHDLIEGCYVRSGLLSDVLVYEDYPSRYREDVSRRHRWIRGDWQLVRWLLPGVPGPDGRRMKNPLSLLSRWKLFDNLRRSLVPSALTLMLLLGWMLPPSPWLWTLSVTAIILVPFLISSLLDLIRKPDEVLWEQYLVTAGKSSADRGFRFFSTSHAFLMKRSTVWTRLYEPHGEWCFRTRACWNGIRQSPLTAKAGMASAMSA